jgi:DNA sulfur modification protein DndD
MILDKLTLNNYCVYRGEQTVDLRPATRNGKSRAVVLFGGINGGGKTTILDAIQLVLYGNRATCSKKSEKSYEQFLRESINRGVPASQGASISLSFQYASDGEQNTYEVQRKWSMKGSKIKESVVVRKNGQTDRWLSENWTQQVEDLLPQGISQLCFFDAEKIRFLAEDETSNDTLGSAIKSLLGLDLAERLIADTSVLEGRIAKRARPSAQKSELEALEKAFAEKSSEVTKLMQDAAALENTRLIAQNRLSEAERSFESVGGKHWTNRLIRQQELSATEGRLEALNSQLIELASNELPLSFLQKLLASLQKRVTRSKESKESLFVLELLSNRDKKLLKEMALRKVDSGPIAIVREFLESDRQSRTAVAHEAFDVDMSDHSLDQLRNLSGEAIKIKKESASAMIAMARKLSHDIEDLQRALSATPNESSIKDAAESLKRASQDFAVLDQQSQRLNAALDVERQARSVIEEQLKRLRKKFADEEISNEEDTRLLQLLSRTQETMQVFLRRATENKIGRLAEFISESFRFLLRKKTLVERVLIDPITFEIQLEDSIGQRISKQQLSEGEKQIFAVSVLWGLSRASARPLPAIIDTPMGRLDAEHRNALLERYFPNASHQVVILSTDTEIEVTAFKKLQSSIARAYHLDYDDAEKCTTATEGYFWKTSFV